ncbi:heterokaryon incompatibility protein-domain-containing protein [Nemania serpens]|nr:heterokaryon incompatibility protein-domain-containing protein [Nemania serpens]
MESRPHAWFLCDRCRLIFRDGSYKEFQMQEESNPVAAAAFGQHHPTADSIQRASASGCWICKRIQEGDPDDLEPPPFRLSATRYYFRDMLTTSWDSIMNNGPRPEYILGFVNDYGESVEFLLVPPEEANEIEPDFDTACYHSIEQLSTGSMPTLELARTWLSHCEDNHHNCRKGQQRNKHWHPSRLLSLSSDSFVRLVISHDNSDAVWKPYATLSHCWGSREFFKLTSETIPLFLEGVNTACLPLTFQETISVVRSLGIAFLWIDSYCIIQGTDEEARDDWACEVKNMRHVYQNSHLNIAATESTNPFHGLLRHRDHSGLSTLRIFWRPCTAGRENGGKIFTCYHAFRNPAKAFLFDLERVYESPLFKRGWVIQEAVLCPRMLSFSSTGLLWQCGEAARSDSSGNYAVGQPHSAESSLMPRLALFWALTPDADIAGMTSHIKAESSTLTNGSYLIRWFDILEAYCGTRLSYPEKDVFAAIEGMGQEMAISLRSDYCYGTVTSALTSSLLWIANSKRARLSGLSGFPSWHWSSYNGQKFGWCKIGNGQYYHSSWTRPVAHCFLEGTLQELASPGSLDTARFWPYLGCLGRLLPLREPVQGGKAGQQHLRRGRETILYCLLPDDIRVSVYCTSDYATLPHATEVGQLFFLPLRMGFDTRSQQTALEITGLVVLEIPSTGCYRRLGVGTIGRGESYTNVNNVLLKAKPRLLFLS